MPSFVTPTSNEMMSPSSARYSPGMPWTIIAFGEMHIAAGIALVALRGRDAALRRDVLVGDRVELEHRDARLEPLLHERERAGHDLAGASHQLDLVRALADDHVGPRPFTCSRACWISTHTWSAGRSAWSGTSLPVDAVVLDDRLGLRVVDREPVRDRLGRVVGALLLAGAAEHAVGRDLVGEVEVEDRVELAVEVAQQLVERVALRLVAREAVEDEAVVRVCS